MKKWKTLLLVALLPLGLAATACNGDDDDDQDTGMVTDTGADDTGEMDTGEADTGTEDTGEADTGTEDTGDQDAMADAGDTAMCPIDQEDVVNVSGTVALHPAATIADDQATVASSQIAMISASQAVGGDTTPLQTLTCAPAVGTIPNDAMGASAEFTIENVDVSSLALGLVGLVDDAADATEDNFIPTATGLISPGDIGDEITGVRAFGVTASAETALSAAVASEIDGVDGNAGDLIAKGFILGIVVDDQGNPVEGATASGFTGANVQVVYPSADLSGASSGTDASTSANGIFIATDVQLSNGSIVAEKGMDATKECWGKGSAKSNAGLAFALPLAPIDCSEL